MDIVLYALTALLYGGLCAVDWRALRRARTLFGGAPQERGASAQRLKERQAKSQTQRRQPAHALHAVLPARAPGMNAMFRALLFVALAAHGVLLILTIFPRDGMVFGFAFALSAMFWLGAIIYWIESFFFALDGLRLLLLPLAAIASLLPLVFGGVRVLPYAAALMFKLHFVIANVAYGLFVLAALHAVLMLAVERWLHAPRAASSERMGGINGTNGTGLAGGARVGSNAVRPGWLAWLASWLDTLPPLLTLEKLLFRLIGAGFVLLTLTLVSGILFSEQLLGQPLSFDHKTVFALLSWLMFGALLGARRLSGWRGRAALRWVLASFVALLLAYVGSRFVFEVLLHRPVV